MFRAGIAEKDNAGENPLTSDLGQPGRKRAEGRRQRRHDYADVARLGHVTRTRLSQVMDLLLLAPDIQEQILFMPAVAPLDW